MVWISVRRQCPKQKADGFRNHLPFVLAFRYGPLNRRRVLCYARKKRCGRLEGTRREMLEKIFKNSETIG
jgi:hypothetical protein